MKIKKIVVYILSPPLFYIGDLVSKANSDDLPDWLSSFLAHVYVRTMQSSYLLEEWAGVEIMWHAYK